MFFCLYIFTCSCQLSIYQNRDWHHERAASWAFAETLCCVYH